MTYLLDDNGNEIVLNTEVTVTKQVISFLKFQIKGDFSTNFKIPNTSNTRRALNYYGVNQSEKVAFSDQPWGLYKDGNLLRRGYLVVQGDETVKGERQGSLDCFFVSGNASWINLLQGNLKELNWSSYDQDFTVTNLASLRAATTGMTFPLLDWGYNFKKGTTDFMVQPIVDSSNDPLNFVYDFYPAFYLKTIVKEIAKQKQFKITGNIFEDPRFDKMVIPLPFIDRTLGEPVYMTNTDSYASNQYIGAGATVTVTFGYQSNSDSLLDLTNGRIQNDNRSRNVRVRTYFDFDSAFSGEVYLRKNGVTIETYTFSIDSVLRYTTVSLAPNDYLDVQVKNNSGATRSIEQKYFGYQFCGSWYDSGLKILAVDVIPSTQILEIIKYVAQAFNCIVSFDDFSKTISFNKIDSVRKENATDLTDTIVQYEVEWQNGFSQQNYIRTNQTEDIEVFNKQERKFGEYVFDGPGNGKAQSDVFELKFGPSLVKQQERSYFDWHLSNIPLFKLEDDGDPITFSTVTNSSGNARFDISVVDTIPVNSVVRITDNAGLYEGYFVVQTTSTTLITAFGQRYIGTSSGIIRRQKIAFTLNAGFRVLLNYTNYTLTKIGTALVQASGTANNVRVRDESAGTDYSSWNVAYYYIPESKYSFSDELRLGAHPGPIENSVSLPMANSYYNRIGKIAMNPKIKVRLRLSETLFNTIDLSEFVYVDLGTWQGYSFLQKIDNYKDSITECRAELLKVD